MAKTKPAAEGRGGNESDPNGESSNFNPWDPEQRPHRAAQFAAMRSGCPFAHTEHDGGYWVASRYADVFELAHQTDLFASSPGVMIPPIPRAPQMHPMETDPPRHEALRKLLLPRFTPKVMAGWKPKVRGVINGLIDDFIEDGEAELTEALVKPLPMFIICTMMGIEDDIDKFWGWIENIIYGRLEDDPTAMNGACDALYAYMTELVAKRRAEGGGEDLVSLLLGADLEDSWMTEADMIGTCFFLLIAGLDNTGVGIRNGLRHVASDAELRDRLHGEPRLVATAIEEVLRLYTPVSGLCRTATKDTELEGRPVAEGERVLLLFASANRDETEFPDPDSFRVDRKINRHIAFGAGIHRCLGSNLARLEIRTAVEEVLRRMPDVRLCEGEDPDWFGFDPLRVEFTPGVREGEGA